MRKEILLIIIIATLLFSGCETVFTFTPGSPSNPNTCCVLSYASGKYCMNDISDEQCTYLNNLYSSYFTSKVYYTSVTNSCADPITDCIDNMACNDDGDNIYPVGQYICGDDGKTVMQCVDGAGVVVSSCNTCMNTVDCLDTNVVSVGTKCSASSLCCEDSCTYLDECDNDVLNLCGEMCTRNTDGNSCNSGAGVCSGGTCVLANTLTNVKKIDASIASNSNEDSCAILNNGSMFCWGSDYYGILGDRDTTEYAKNIAIPVLSIRTVNMSQGSYHTCAVLTDKTVKCWGSNYYGQIGNGSKSTTVTNWVPTTVVTVKGGAALSNVVDVVVGAYDYTCALISDGTVKCWGNNDVGQIGNGSKCSSCNNVVPTTVVTVKGGAALSNVISISAGMSHNCALLSGGSVKCWGGNYYGQIGNGSKSGSVSNLVPTTVVTVKGGAALSNVISISAGESHTCALISDGTVKCWGYNSYGQLGDGTKIEKLVPNLVSGISNVISISAGSSYTCAVISDGTVKCWGYNYYGQLGDGTKIEKLVPTQLSGINNTISVAAGASHTCVLLTDGTVKCWGYNGYGQVGDGTWVEKLTPVNTIW